MNDVILTTPSELSTLIYDQVKKALAEHQPPPPPETDRFFTVPELCAYLPGGAQPQTVYLGCSQRKIPFSKQGRRLIFLKSEIDLWLRSGRRKTFAEMQEEAKQPKR